jgi:hypothetical protein
VLTSPHALRYCKPRNGDRLPYRSDSGTSSSKELKSSACGFNQLKYVNKEIYREANALELRYNTLRFAYRPESRSLASTQLIDFVGSLPTPRKSLLCTILLDHSEQDDYSDVSKACVPLDKPQSIAMLSQICTQHPKISLRYTLTRWNTAATAGILSNSFEHYAMSVFVLRGVSLVYMLRPENRIGCCPS